MDGAKERLRLVKADLMMDGSFDEAVDPVMVFSILPALSSFLKVGVSRVRL